MRLDTDRIVELLRGFYAAYRERFDALAPPADAPLPVLTMQSLDLVRVNGGRALHFFFTEPAEAQMVARRVTRLHDIEVHPGSTEELKGLESGERDAHREQVMRTADIGGPLYVHFVIYPEDGALADTLADVAGRVAEREVRGPASADDADARGDDAAAAEGARPVTFRGGGAKKPPKDPTRDWIQPAP